MKGSFGVSNLAWPPSALDEALALLAAQGCTAVEIAPWAVFGRWDNIAQDARRLRAQIESHGLVCAAMQGILFGAGDMALFGTEAQRAGLEAHLERVAALADLLGAGACVFGAPKQRDPGDLEAAAAWDIALSALRRIGPAFAAAGSALAFEANATRYACRFVTTTAEAARLVREAATPGIGLQIDTGTLFLESEDPAILVDVAPIAVHAHISEPELQPVGAHCLDHAAIAGALRDSGYAGSVSIEMKAVDPWAPAVTQAIGFVRRVYA